MENPEFGRRAKERRDALGLSQKQVADQVGVSQPAIAKIEAGGSTTTTRGFALARALQTTLEWLEFGNGSAPSLPLDWNRLDEVGRAKAEAYISGLLAQSTPLHHPTTRVDEDRPAGD
ncbi:helix-turn-helix transcriptional regulator [Burkholderia stagnalis]|uniref:helix-turn-helix transcriptional regulator n=1 Tax=Burkholderia stagnalis TaxID=1503054 RepID=UPI0018C4E139|nr:helix-turn-helix transcriptional regulator [Burkholderia stagnalis]